MHVKDRPYLTRHSLHSSPPQPSPCRLLCLTLLQSFLVILVLPLLFFCFDPPNARPCTDQGGIEPHRHPIATWYIGRKTDHGGHPKWLGNCLKLVTLGTTAPQTPYSHFVRNEQLQPSLTAGFRNRYSVRCTYTVQKPPGQLPCLMHDLQRCASCKASLFFCTPEYKFSAPSGGKAKSRT